MPTVRQNIITNLQNELSYIQPSNGYNTKIKNVYVGHKNLASVTQYPSITFYLGTDIIKEEIESGGQIREIDLVILGYLQANTEASQDGNLTTQIERFYSDLYKFFYKYQNINSSKTSTLNEISNVIDFNVSEKQSFIETNQNKCLTGILLKVFYFEDPTVIEQSNVSSLGPTGEV